MRNLRSLSHAALALALSLPVSAMFAQAPAAAPTPAPAPAPGGGEAAPPRPELTVEELQRLIAVPSGAQLGAEADERSDRQGQLFKDDMLKRAALGETPRYIYFAIGPDPMIIPWVRQNIVAQELLDRARKLQAEGELEKAIEVLQEVVDKYPATSSAIPAKQLLEQIRVDIANQSTGTPGAATPAADTVKLPAAVRDNTLGIFFAGADSIVLVFDEALKVGDAVPRYPGVTVKRVEANFVVYEFQGKEFEVEVDSTK